MSKSLADRIVEIGIPKLAESILVNWKRYGKLAGDEPTLHEQTMARVAAETMWAEAVVAALNLRPPKEGG